MELEILAFEMWTFKNHTLYSTYSLFQSLSSLFYTYEIYDINIKAD